MVRVEDHFRDLGDISQRSAGGDFGVEHLGEGREGAPDAFEHVHHERDHEDAHENGQARDDDLLNAKVVS